MGGRTRDLELRQLAREDLEPAQSSLELCGSLIGSHRIELATSRTYLKLALATARPRTAPGLLLIASPPQSLDRLPSPRDRFPVATEKRAGPPFRNLHETKDHQLFEWLLIGCRFWRGQS